MRAQRLPDGRIRIPTVVHTPDGGLAHATLDIDIDDPRYASYDDWLHQESVDAARRAGVV